MHRSSGTRFYISDLLPECEDEDLQEYFGKFGQVVEAVVVRDKETSLSKCFGFVRMANPALTGILQGDHQIWEHTFSCKAADKTAEDDGAKVWVGDLPRGILETELASHFARYGHVAEATLDVDGVSACVRMSDVGSLDRILREAQHVLSNGAHIVVKAFHDRPTGAFGQGVESRFFVGNLPDEASEEDLTKYFTKFGEITEMTIVKGKPFGFVKFAVASEELTRVMLEERHDYLGRKLEVRRAAKGKGKGRTKDGAKDGNKGDVMMMQQHYGGYGKDFHKGDYGKGDPNYKGGPYPYKGDAYKGGDFYGKGDPKGCYSKGADYGYGKCGDYKGKGGYKAPTGPYHYGCGGPPSYGPPKGGYPGHDSKGGYGPSPHHFGGVQPPPPPPP
mmetsp:Transcript_13448/g.31621  ORF Transcript_13448/g.31621 Transcript_13448/m.31621 type:complete len:389 (+) Transcript_13448:142-1308(+)|eukprot:CAMPEP_0178426074 /NCGR_PEP_ID=MMETSP0689_2-20121128/29049_1 /TAXON_ID=160604 /ORGANISM="Amphidinium massartii, Strain CS-259" /LENGTH=388 /DNA_ID=CAMNT_0020047753 /DNA_START=104 /DNA_END=1270 /DNA_ORIENTATION=+